MVRSPNILKVSEWYGKNQQGYIVKSFERNLNDTEFKENCLIKNADTLEDVRFSV